MTPTMVRKPEEMRGALARRSSAASGFFFCGMMLEPDEKSSATSQKPNSSLDHSTISEPSRERCIAQIADAERWSSTKSRFETASIEFGVSESKPSSRATASRSRSQFSPASAPEPSGSAPARPATAANRRASRSSIQK